jgi:uncharacterized protein (TIGR02147 family)
MQDFDYRDQLRQIFSQKQSENSHYSGRAFARDLGISVTALHGVLNQSRHLAKNNLTLLAQKLNWNPEQYEQALESTKLVEDPTATLLDEDQFQSIANWIHLAILNLAKIPNTHFDDLSRRLGINPEVCTDAVERLIRLGYVGIDENFCLQRLSPNFGIRKQTPSSAIQAFHFSNLLKAQKAIRDVPIQNRNFLTIAAPTNKKKLTELHKLIEEFRKQALHVFESDDPDDVYFLNIQLYPVTASKVNTNEID